MSLTPMERVLRKHLLDLGSAYCAETGYAPKTVAQKACGDFRFFERVQNGASFTVKTYDRALQFFSDHWPNRMPWPNDIERPSPSAVQQITEKCG